MNKKRYKTEVDSVVPSDEFKERISKLPESKKQKKKSKWPVAAAIAACFALIVVAVPAAGGAFNSASKMADSVSPTEGYYNTDESESIKVDAPGSQNPDLNAAERKIIKTASINVDVKELEDFLKIIKNEIDSIGGYVSSENKSVYDFSSSCTLVVKVPAEKLHSFINVVDNNSTVTSQQVDSDDISAEYIDTEAKIKSLETEQATLLKLIEKAENLNDIIQLQDRLAEIRSELDSCKSAKKLMDNQVEYSSVTIYINEKERTVKTDGSFISQVKEKFLDSIYSIGDFFREFAITILGGSPYIAIIAVIAVIAVVIIKKKRKK